MAIHGNVFDLFFSFGKACGTILFAVATGALFPAAWAGNMGQCSVYLSLMFMTLPICL
jgi:hypothetical protein